MKDEEILAAIIRLETKMDALPEREKVVDKRLDAHAHDIKSLREWRFYYGGVFAALGAYLGLGKH